MARKTLKTYPAVQLMLGLLEASGASGEVAEAFQISQDGAVRVAATGAGIVCSKLKAFIRRSVLGLDTPSDGTAG